MMAEGYDWKNLSFVVTTGAATFGPIVPSMMHMEIKEISYSNLTNAQNQVILRQIPSGTVRPPHSVIIDQQSIAPLAPYSPRIPIRTVQEDHVIEASSSAGPCIVNLVYRLKYGRP
jgi:hypothetical protein